MTERTEGRPRANSAELRTSNGRATRSRSYDPRGSAADRRNRKNWMLSSDEFKHDSSHQSPNVFCSHGCGTMLTYDTVEADKKDPSGTYRRSNVQPSCRSCNIKRSNNPNWVHPSKLAE